MISTLITGVTGLLGRTIIFENNKQNFLNIIGGYYPDKKYPTLEQIDTKYLLDIRDKNKIQKIVETENIEVIINCASIAAVDYVENNKQECYDINFVGLKNLTDICKTENIKLIHISSNAVYDGNNPPYAENDERNPLNYYGKIKVMEEDYIVEHLNNCSIVRPILMYGWNDSFERMNPLTWQLEMQNQNKELKIVDDIYCNPLLANDCAKLILKIINENINDIFNIGGAEKLSRYQFALKIAEYTGYDKNKIQPVKNSFFKTIAPRPMDTTLCNNKIINKLNFKPMSFEQGFKYLEHYISRKTKALKD